MFIKDFQLALRKLFNEPKFTAMTLLLMSIGMSLCIYMFSFMHGAVFGDLPFEGGTEIRKVGPIDNGRQIIGENNFRIHEYEYLKANQTQFEMLDAYRVDEVNVLLSDRAARKGVAYVSAAFFSVSHAKPILGRILTSSDMQPGAQKVMVIREHVWRELFASDPDIIGKTVELDNIRHRIVGVLPAEYGFPAEGEIWLPYTFSAKQQSLNDADWVSIYGKLSSATNEATAELEIEKLMSELAAHYPKTNANRSAHLWIFSEAQVGGGAAFMKFTMELSVVLILFLAAINTGNLLLARALEKQKDYAIRLALGAPKIRLVMQMFWESLLVCVMAGVLSLLFAGFLLDTTIDFLAANSGHNGMQPFWWQKGISPFMVWVTIIVCLFTALLTGLLPGLRLVNSDFNAILRDGTRGAQSKNASRLSQWIVGVEIALSCLLLLVSVTLVDSVYKQNKTPIGVKQHSQLTALINLPESTYPTNELRQHYFRQLQQQLEQYPEIKSVTFAAQLPGSQTWRINAGFSGVEYGKEPIYPRISMTRVDHHYFSSLGVKLVEGRLFNEADKPDSPAVVVVTQAFAEQYFPGQSALGEQVTWQNIKEPLTMTIVGVVSNIRHGGGMNKAQRSQAVVLGSLQQETIQSQYLILSFSGKTPPANLINKTIFNINPQIPAVEIMTLERSWEKEGAGMNYLAKVFMGVAFAASVLAFTGIYGVIAQASMQKTQEIGIRRALGAENNHIFSFFVKQSAWVLACGLLSGGSLGLLMISKMAEEGFVYWTPLIILVPILIILVVVFAVFNPVQKLLRREPIYALRYE